MFSDTDIYTHMDAIDIPWTLALSQGVCVCFQRAVRGVGYYDRFRFDYLKVCGAKKCELQAISDMDITF